MKKRIGKINKNIEELNSLEKTPSELLDLFLQEKEAFNASTETIKQYRYHCVQFIQTLGNAAKEPGYKVLTPESYKEFILTLKERNIKDVSVASIASSVRTSELQDLVPRTCRFKSCQAHLIKTGFLSSESGFSCNRFYRTPPLRKCQKSESAKCNCLQPDGSVCAFYSHIQCSEAR